MKITHKLYDEDHGLAFWCPGCKMHHYVATADYPIPGWGPGSQWTFDGNFDNPTLSPSVLNRYRWKDKEEICHIFVKEGQIQFLPECTHHLAGQTVPMTEIKNKAGSN